MDRRGILKKRELLRKKDYAERKNRGVGRAVKGGEDTLRLGGIACKVVLRKKKKNSYSSSKDGFWEEVNGEWVREVNQTWC